MTSHAGNAVNSRPRGNSRAKRNSRAECNSFYKRGCRVCRRDNPVDVLLLGVRLGFVA